MIKKILTSMLFVGLTLIAMQPLKASAASAWSFRSAQETIKKDDTIIMSDYQYKNFDLLKNNVLINESKDGVDDYTVVWESGDEDIVWINKNTGQARANKFGRFIDDCGTVLISAKITNMKTGKQIVRSFSVNVDTREIFDATEEEDISPTIAPTPDSVISENNEQTTVYSKRGIKKITLGSTWKTDVNVLLDTFDFYFGDNVLKASDILGISSVDYTEVGTPVAQTFIRTISLNIRVKALNPFWENPNHYIVERVEINHYFDIVD